ncbi:hypothetical protein FACS1894170_06110 [Planctomycetales bacterium]|nr:hypothetical protein FACS1894170_06110 [Planctomycetales bacterium]
MTNWYYYDNNGQKWGLITSSQLKIFADNGTIAPETMLETEKGQLGRARQVKGLFAQSSVRSTMMPSQGDILTADEQPAIPIILPVVIAVLLFIIILVVALRPIWQTSPKNIVAASTEPQQSEVQPIEPQSKNAKPVAASQPANPSVEELPVVGNPDIFKKPFGEMTWDDFGVLERAIIYQYVSKKFTTYRIIEQRRKNNMLLSYILEAVVECTDEKGITKPYFLFYKYNYGVTYDGRWGVESIWPVVNKREDSFPSPVYWGCQVVIPTFKEAERQLNNNELVRARRVLQEYMTQQEREFDGFHTQQSEEDLIRALSKSEGYSERGIEKAVQYFRDNLSRERALLYAIEDAFNKGDYRKSINLADAYLKQSTDMQEACAYGIPIKARALFRLKRYDESAECYRMVLKAYDWKLVGITMSSVLQLSLLDLLTSESDAAKLVISNCELILKQADDPQAFRVRGLARLFLGQNKLAQIDFENAERLVIENKKNTR